MYTIDRDKWKPTNCLSVQVFLRIGKPTDWVSSRRTQSHMYVSARSTFPRCTRPRIGSAKTTLGIVVPSKLHVILRILHKKIVATS